LLGRDHTDVADKPSVIIIGQAALQRTDGAAVLAAAMALAEATNSSFMVLHTAAARVGAIDIGATNEGGMAAVSKAEVIFNLGADEVDVAAGPFVIYQGSHGDRGAHRADIILPGAAYTEEPGLFVNTEGRPQLALRAGFAPGDAKENWAILRALSAEVDAKLEYDSIAQLRQALVKDVPHLAKIDDVPENKWNAVEQGKLMEGAYQVALRDFYLSNPIARASELMAQLSANAKARNEGALAAE
ncbi:MAG: molybdopterin-dependent oxidoreductase, partial [Marinomonas sp.]